MSGEAPGRCGFVALVGRPNVGKSTLLNALLGEKVSIVSRKPQTTRHRIVGVRHRADAQIVYVDTPGLHDREATALNRYLNRAAAQALDDVDLIVLVTEGLRWTAGDDQALRRIGERPFLWALNKVDRVRDKRQLLPHIEEVRGRCKPLEVVPVSARRGTNLDALEEAVARHLPEGPPLFPAEQRTDRDERFRIAELLREQLMEGLGEEVPYATTVEIEALSHEADLTRVAALIWVERPGQKAIVIGRRGERLKRIASAARREIEGLLGRQVHLEVWVKVRAGWSDDERALRSFGYEA